MVGEKAERGAQPMLIHELDDREQLFQPILQRCAGENDRVGRCDPLDRTGDARGPVLDALGLIENDQIGRPTGDQIQIGVHGVVVGDLVKALGSEADLTVGAEAADDRGRPADELGDLAFPLMFQ